MMGKNCKLRLLIFNLATDVDDPILGFTTSWICALAKRCEYISVITMRAGRVEVPENVMVYSVGKERGYSEPRRVVEFYRHLFMVLRKGCPNVCFSHMIPIFTILAAPMLKVKGIPIVTWYLHPSLTLTLKLAHHLSNRMVSSLRTSYPYKHGKLVIIGHGIDMDIFLPNDMLPETPPMILCVGRLSPVKDHPTLLKAAYLLKQRWREPFRVILVGGPAVPQDKEYIDSLHEQVKTLGLQDVVSFDKPVPIAELVSWYRRCTVHVNLTPRGSGDKVAWEAMSCGRPCLVANDGFQETLGQWANLLIFRYGDAENLAQKIEQLLKFPDAKLQAIGAGLNKSVINRHSLQRLTDKLLELFEEL